MADNEIKPRSPKVRQRRAPLGTRNVLTVKGQDPNYVYRVVNDQGDRIEQMRDYGYEVVKASDVRVGDKRVNSPVPEGSAAVVSVGGGQKAVVMRKPRDEYEEDNQAKLDRVRAIEDSIKNPSGDGVYGKVAIDHMK